MVLRIPAVRGGPVNDQPRAVNHSYRVFLVKVHQVPGTTDAERTAVFQGMTERLRDFFAAVADHDRSAPQQIMLVWVDDVAELVAQNPAAHEIIVFFLRNFDDGFLRPFFERDRSRYGPLLQMARHPNAEVGLCHHEWDEIREYTNDRDEVVRTEVIHPKWVFAEVHMDLTAATDRGYLGPPQQVEGATTHMQDGPRWVGVDIGGVAIHEIMHAKVDTAHFTGSGANVDESFNIHSDGGGGPASPDQTSGPNGFLTGYRSPPTTRNLELLKPTLMSGAWVFNIPRTGQLELPPAPPARPARRRH